MCLQLETASGSNCENVLSFFVMRVNKPLNVGLKQSDIKKNGIELCLKCIIK